MKSLPRARAPASAPELGRLQKLSQLSRPQAARFPEAASQRGGPSQVSCPGAAGPLSLGQEEAALARQCDGCLVASPHEGTSSFLPPQHRKQPQAPRSSGQTGLRWAGARLGFTYWSQTDLREEGRTRPGTLSGVCQLSCLEESPPRVPPEQEERPVTFS